MKTLSMLVATVACAVAFGTATDAEAAKRLGGGKSLGMQKQMTTPDRGAAAAPAVAPKPAAPGAAAVAPAAAPAAASAASTGRSWMGPVAGLAAGLGLAALASHFGFGDELASFMLMALVAVAVMAAVGFFLRRRAASGPSPAMAGAGRHQYAGSESGARPSFDVAMPAGGSAVPGAAAPAAAVAEIPAGFDAEGFLRSAKVHFIRLQAANDAGNVADLREFTTPEMFAELKMDIDERGAASQATDVVQVDAALLSVTEESARYVASVRFDAAIREGGQPTEQIAEVWHLVKSRDGGGWLLAGIQQIA